LTIGWKWDEPEEGRTEEVERGEHRRKKVPQEKRGKKGRSYQHIENILKAGHLACRM